MVTLFNFHPMTTLLHPIPKVYLRSLCIQAHAAVTYIYTLKGKRDIYVTTCRQLPRYTTHTLLNSKASGVFKTPLALL